MSDLEKYHVYHSCMIDDYTTRYSLDAQKKVIVKDDLRHKLAKTLVEKYISEGTVFDIPGTTNLSLELMVFSMDEFREFMSQMADRFRGEK